MSEKRYTLLIADDEQLERDALAFLISKSNFSVNCIKAKNGREAVELARTHSPQIVFLDIQMPGMDGLEAGRLIKEIVPDCQLAYLTAWGNFGFAQEALRLGACDYLVKPSDASALYALLDKCIASYERGKAPGKEFKKVLNLFTREFFASLKFGNLSEDAIRSYLSLQGIESEQGVALVVSAVDPEVLKDAFFSVSSSIGVCYFSSSDRVTVLAFTNKQSQLVDYLQRHVGRYRGQGLTIGFGMFFDTITGIPQSIHGASLAYTCALHNGRSIVGFSEVANNDGSDIRSTIDTIVLSMERHVLAGEVGPARQAAHELVDAIILHYEDTVARQELYEVLLVFCHGIRNEIPHFHRDKPLMGTMMEQEIFLMDFIDAACEAILRDKTDKYGRAFELVDQYLHAHYAQTICAEDLADLVQINRGYFSKLFKEYFGVSFVEYVTEIRMNKAAKLLQEGTTVRETASLTGYADHNYFSRVFRQYYGESPKSYKAGQSG